MEKSGAATFDEPLPDKVEADGAVVDIVLVPTLALVMFLTADIPLAIIAAELATAPAIPKGPIVAL